MLGKETGEYATDPYAESLCSRIRICGMCIENLNSIYFNEDQKHVNLCCTHLHVLALRRWGMYIHTFFFFISLARPLSNKGLVTLYKYTLVGG